MTVKLRSVRRLLLSILLLVGSSSVAQVPGQSGYHIENTYTIPGNGYWDYIEVDGKSHRLYVAHGDEIDVLDSTSGEMIGRVKDTPGAHGVALAPELSRGFVSNGLGNSVTIFSTTDLSVTKTVKVNQPDFILYDSYSHRVFPFSKTTTVLDAWSGDPVGKVDLGGDPEAGVSDGKGTVYVNLADKSSIAVINTKTITIRNRYPLENCATPHSLLYDRITDRLFVGCQNGLEVVDASRGTVVGRSVACSNVDGAGFDPEQKLIFESCYEGVVSVIRQWSPDYYDLVDTVRTALFAKTMAFDPVSRKLFLPRGEFEIVPDKVHLGSFKRQLKPNSFSVIVLSKQ
jgi:hypothetical protein